MGFTPQLVDLDGDSRFDIISGSWPGQLYFFRRQPDGTFAKVNRLKDKDDEEINLGNASTVFAVDWDSDGDLDLLVGNISGKVHFVRNESGGKPLVFGEAVELLSLKKRKLGDSHPVAADWDGDGKLDLLVGHSEGGVLWCRNVGTQKQPKLSEPTELIPSSPLPSSGDDQRNPNDWGVRAKICCVDWNGDGRLDILLGDYCGGFSMKPDQTAEELNSERQALERLPKLRKSWAAAFREYRKLLADKSAASTSDRAERLKKLRAKMNRFKKQISRCQKVQQEFQPQQQAHGFVWLFLRKSTSD